MRAMIVGTAGHIDHGKTSLTKALTGVDTDRLREEKERGITIDLGFAYLPMVGDGIVGFVDVPGHERFVHNMLAGATGIDFALLVVAADDGPKPQTREHLQILDLLDVRRGLVALTKIDKVDANRIDRATADIRRLLAGTTLADAPILPVSSVTGEGVDDLKDLLHVALLETVAQRVGGRFRLAVDRSFTLPGIGTVVTGTAVAGRVAVGDTVTVTPAGLQARVRTLHVQNRSAEEGRAGQRCAINLSGPQIEKAGIRRGDWIVAPAAHLPVERFDVRLRLLATETRPIRHWTPVHLHLGAIDVPARVALLESDGLAPGGSALAQIVAQRPIGALRGDRFILRDQSALRTIGGGMVVDSFPPARGRRAPQRLAILTANELPTAADAFARRLEIEKGGLNLARFADAWNLMPDEAASLVAAMPVTTAAVEGDMLAFRADRWEDMRRAALAALKKWHGDSPETPGPTADRLRLAITERVPKLTFATLLATLVKERAVLVDGPWYALPGHRPSFTAADELLWGKIHPLLAAGDYQPPRVRDIAGQLRVEENRVRNLMRRAMKMGRLIEIAHDHFFPRQVVADLVRIADQIGQCEGVIVTAQFRDRIGTGRKVAIQILEYFDRVGLTRRYGDDRRFHPAKLKEMTSA